LFLAASRCSDLVGFGLDKVGSFSSQLDKPTPILG
jgi:hypothetical protein